MIFHELIRLDNCNPSCEGTVVFHSVILAAGFERRNCFSCTYEFFTQIFQAAVNALSTACLGCAGIAGVAFQVHTGVGGQRASEDTRSMVLLAASQSTRQAQGLSIIPSQGSTVSFGAYLSYHMHYSHRSCPIQNCNSLYFNLGFNPSEDT